MEQEYINKIIESDQRSKSNSHRIEKLECGFEEIKELTIAIKEIAMETKANREDVSDMNCRLKAIEEKPAKRLENMTGIVITCIITAFVGFILGKIGL